MIKIMIMAILMLLPILSIAQTESKTTYIIDNYHNRSCLGGLGTCRESELTVSKEKTTASVSKISEDKLQVILDKAGFTTKEWEELLTNKNFPIDVNITIDEELLMSIAIETKYKTIKANNYKVVVEKDRAIFILELIER